MKSISSRHDRRRMGALCAATALLGCAASPVPPPALVESARPPTVVETASAKPDHSPPQAARVPEFLVAMVGTWGVEDSFSKFRIAIVDGKVTVDGWDTLSGDWFEIPEVRVLPDSLFFRAIFPSTHRETSQKLTVIDGNTLHVVRTHDADVTETTMRRDPGARAPSTKAVGAGGVP
jgi:hypothetical protein